MYKLDLPLDQKQQAAIERRRNQELARQSRIFNAKIRTIGVDVDAINQQVQDKKRREDRERLRDEAFAADAVRADKIGVLLEQRQNNDQRNINMAENAYRFLNQKPDGRREWDLYDPDSKLKDKPARVADDDPRCGPASIQKFEGEDLNTKARVAFQREQNRDWLDAQAKEKDLQKSRQTEADRLYDLKRIELDVRALELEALERQTRKNIKMATDNYNRALAQDMETRRSKEKQSEEDDNLTEIANHVYGDVLTENPDVALSAFGPHRIVPDRWKGMNMDQLEVIKNTQAAQQAENAKNRAEEKRLNAEWDHQRVAAARAALLMERAEMEKAKNIRANQDTKNLALAKEQKDQKKFLDKVVYTNPPTAHYFTQFNTTTR